MPDLEPSVVIKVRVPRHTPLAQHLERVRAGSRARELLSLSQLGFLMSQQGTGAGSASQLHLLKAPPAPGQEPATVDASAPSAEDSPAPALPEGFIDAVLEFGGELAGNSKGAGT